MNRFRALQRPSFLAACFVILVAAFALPTVAGAAQDDCYPSGCGSTTTSEPPAPGPSCGISLEAGIAGVEVIATVHNVPVGGIVRILLDGDEVARGENTRATSQIRTPLQGTDDVVMSFDIPDLPAGTYSLVAVGVGFTVTCGGGGLEVLASSAGTGGGGGGGGLAFTGGNVLVLVVVALALLAVGWYLVRRQRSRTA